MAGEADPAPARRAPEVTAVRWLAVVLAVPQLFTGVWAVVATHSWYADFPGLGPTLVAATPPYNPHLASDAGAGFLATGAALLYAAAHGRAVTLRLATTAYLVFALAHGAFHLLNPAPGLTGTENLVNVLVLAAAVALPVTMLWLLRRRRDRR